MQYVPYGRLLTIDQANAVHMAAEAKEKKVKTWLKIQAIAWLIGLIALPFDTGYIFMISNSICYFIGLFITGMPRALQFILILPNWIFFPPLHTLLTLSALKKQKKACKKFLEANGIF